MEHENDPKFQDWKRKARRNEVLGLEPPDVPQDEEKIEQENEEAEMIRRAREATHEAMANSTRNNEGF